MNSRQETTEQNFPPVSASLFLLLSLSAARCPVRIYHSPSLYYRRSLHHSAWVAALGISPSYTIRCEYRSARWYPRVCHPQGFLHPGKLDGAVRCRRAAAPDRHSALMSSPKWPATPSARGGGQASRNQRAIATAVIASPITSRLPKHVEIPA